MDVQHSAIALVQPFSVGDREGGLLLAHGGERLQCSPTKRLGATPSVCTSDLLVEYVSGEEKLRKTLELPMVARRAHHAMLVRADHIGRSVAGEMHLTFWLIGGSCPSLKNSWYAAEVSLVFTCGARHQLVDVAVGSFQTLRAPTPQCPAIVSSFPGSSNVAYAKGYVYVAHHEQKVPKLRILDCQHSFKIKASVPLPSSPMTTPYFVIHVPQACDAQQTVFVLGSPASEVVLCVALEGHHLAWSRLVRAPVKYATICLSASPPTAALSFLAFGTTQWSTVDASALLSQSQTPVAEMICARVVVGAGQIPVEIGCATTTVVDTVSLAMIQISTELTTAAAPRRASPPPSPPPAAIKTQRNVSLSNSVLPADVWHVIGKLVGDLPTLAALSCVCRAAYSAVDDYFWRVLICRKLSDPHALVTADCMRSVAAKNLLSSAQARPAGPMRVLVGSAAHSASMLASSYGGSFAMSDGNSLKLASIPRHRLGPCKVETVSALYGGTSMAFFSHDGRVAAVVAKVQRADSTPSLRVWVESAAGWSLVGKPKSLPSVPCAGLVTKGIDRVGHYDILLVSQDGQCMISTDDAESIHVEGLRMPPLDYVIQAQSNVTAADALYCKGTNGAVLRLRCSTTNAIAAGVFDVVSCRRARYTMHEQTDRGNGLLLIGPTVVSSIDTATGAAASWQVPDANGVCFGAVAIRGSSERVVAATCQKKPLSTTYGLHVVDMATQALLWSAPLLSSPRALVRLPLLQSVLVVGPDATIVYTFEDQSMRVQHAVLHATATTHTVATGETQQLVGTHIPAPVFALCTWDGTALTALPLHLR